MRLAPNRAVFHENLGRAYRKKGMRREAEREIADAARLAPNDTVRVDDARPAAHGAEAARRGRDRLRVGLNLDPRSEEAAAGLSVALMEAGKLPEAETALVKAIDSRPDSALLWNNLGVVRTRRGSFAPAVEAFQKALSLDAGLEAAKDKPHARQRALRDRSGRFVIGREPFSPWPPPLGRPADAHRPTSKPGGARGSNAFRGPTAG